MHGSIIKLVHHVYHGTWSGQGILRHIVKKVHMGCYYCMGASIFKKGWNSTKNSCFVIGIPRTQYRIHGNYAFSRKCTWSKSFLLHGCLYFQEGVELN